MTLDKFLIAFGAVILLSSFFLYFERYNTQRLSFNINGVSGQTNKSTVMPFEIIIPSVNINLPIIPAKIQNRNWEATTKGVSYLLSSPIPGEKGNSILYGHNWPNLLGSITNIKPGRSIIIKFTDGSIKKFIVNSTVIVSPNDVSILGIAKTSQITLYTCVGIFDSKRFVVVAKLTS